MTGVSKQLDLDPASQATLTSRIASSRTVGHDLLAACAEEAKHTKQPGRVARCGVRLADSGYRQPCEGEEALVVSVKTKTPSSYFLQPLPSGVTVIVVEAAEMGIIQMRCRSIRRR